MKFYVIEKEALDELWSAETLGEIIRIGFNRVDVEDIDGKVYNCYDIVDDKVRGERFDWDKKETEIKWFGIDRPIDNGTIYLDRDEDYYTVVNVKIEKEQ